MRKIKRLTALLVSAVLLLSFGGCKKSTDSGKLKIIATGFSGYDFARTVAGDNADVKMLVSAGNEAHTYEPTPYDITEIQNCDLFIFVGGESEKWVEGILSSNDDNCFETVKMMDVCNILKEENGGKEDDEHVWTSLENAKIIVREIEKKLALIDPDNKAEYEKNSLSMTEELDLLSLEISKTVESSKRKTVVFADRFPAIYFTDEFGLSFYSAFPGCSAETEPTPKKIAEIIDYVNENEVPAIFTIELSNKKTAQAVADETGVKILEFNSCHNVPKSDFEKGCTYLSLMKQNLENLKIALN